MHACSAAADPWVDCTMYNECYIQHTILQQLQRCNFDFIFMLSQILPYLQTRSEPLEHARVEVARRYEHTAVGLRRLPKG